MSVIAYGDESVRRTGLREGVYLLGAYVLGDEDAGLVEALGRFARFQGKLHWKDHVDVVKRQVCSEISRHAGAGLIVAATPLPSRGGEERARQQALVTLALALEEGHGVRELVLERRERTQDANDVRTIDLARRSGVLPEDFTIRHEFGASEERLWIPDQIVGACGDHIIGWSTGWADLASVVEILYVDPRR